MPEDEGKLANGSAFPYIQPGALNPVRVPTSAPVIDITKNISGINYIGQTVTDNYAKSATAGTGPWKGVVLRENIKADGKQEDNTTDGWLERIAAIFPNGKIDGSIRNYSIYIPELHSHLPTPTQTFPSNLEDSDNLEQRKIDMFPEFISKDTSIEGAAPGAVVWVDFVNRETFEEGVYLGPVINSSGGAQGQPSGDITGSQSAFNSCSPSTGLQAKPPTGESVAQAPPTEGSEEQTTQQVGEGQNKTQPNQTSQKQECLSSFSSTDQLAGIGNLTEPYSLSLPKAKLVKVATDPVRIGWAKGKGGTTQKLREDVANDMEQVAKILRELGALFSSAGSKRGLTVKGGGNRAQASFHHPGTAWDFYTWPSSLHPGKTRKGNFEFEYFLTKAAGATNKRFIFDVWAHSDKPAGTQYTDSKTGTTFTVEEKTLDILVCRQGKGNSPATTETATVKVVPLTAILKAYGFVRVPARSGWVSRCIKSGDSEWWHFQSHRKLTEGTSTFREALEYVHTEQEIEGAVSQVDQKRVFRGLSFRRR